MEGAGYQASYAVDGDPGTRWSSQFADPQWLQVDLAGAASITQVVLRWEAAYATAYRVEVSPNGSTWTGIYSTTNATGGTQTLEVTGTGRYVRMYGTTRHTGYGYSLWEFEVYGSMAAAVGCDTSTNAADHRPATASYFRQYTPHLDLYAVNSYGSVCGINQDWIDGGYTRPYILTEGGPAGGWEVPNDTNGVPTEPPDPAKRDGYPSGYNCLTTHSGVALGATLFHYGVENDFGGVWLSILTGGWKRLAYHSVRKLYSGQSSANTPPVIASLAAPQSVGPGAKFTVTAGASDPDGDPIRYNLMLSGKYVNNRAGLQYASFTQTGNGTFTVTAPQTLGGWKVYVYAYDGHGNVGIEPRSTRVVPPVVGGGNLATGKEAPASSVQEPLNGVTFGSGATDGNLATRRYVRVYATACRLRYPVRVGIYA
jgi:hypothetical protein